MLHDLRFAFRLLWRESRHTLSVCLTMALAIGATTLLFAVTYGVLMKPLPWPNADRLVLLNETRGGNPPRFGAFSNAAFHAWRDSPRTVEGLAAWSQRSATLTGSGDPERIRVVAASAEPVSGIGRDSLDRVALHRGGRDRRARPGRGAIGAPVAPALQRRSRRARPRRAARRPGAYRGRRPRGRGGISRSHHPRLAPVPGAARRRQLAVDVQCDCGRPAGLDAIPGGRRGNVARPGCARHGDDHDGDLREQRRGRRYRNAYAGGGDRRRPAPADRAACRGRAAAARRDRERGQPAARARDDAAARDGDPRGARRRLAAVPCASCSSRA